MTTTTSGSWAPALKSAVDSLLSTPVRSTLTVVAFAMGTAALAAVLLLSDSLADLHRRQLEASGALNIEVRTQSRYWVDGIAFPFRDSTPTLPIALAARIADRVSSRATVVVVDSAAIETNIGSRRRGIAIISRRIVGQALEAGPSDERAATISKRLEGALAREFGSKRPDTLRLGAETLSIRGLEPTETSGTALAVYVSHTVLGRLTPSHERSIVVIPRRQEIDEEYKATLKDVADEVRRDTLLRGRVEADSRGPGQVGRVTSAMMVFRVSFAAISLLCIVVAGLGAANVVLLATVQRAREIGIRRSVGASRRSIRAQFAAEAIIVAIVGGAVGLVLGRLFIAGVAAFLESRSAIELKVGYTAFAAVVPLLTSVSVGLIAASFPAARAARIDPAEALRDE